MDVMASFTMTFSNGYKQQNRQDGGIVTATVLVLVLGMGMGIAVWVVAVMLCRLSVCETY
jgi:hypothetical protein